MTNLVVQSFGRENEYRRAVLTVLSYYAHTSLSQDKTRVILFTDMPAYFTPYFKGLPVDYVLLTPDKIIQMRGEIDFLHRMKIALIEEAFGMIEGNMLYTDSDTFFVADPSPLLEQVAPQKSYMHIWEHAFEDVRNMPLPAGKTFRAFLALIESKKFKLTDGREIEVRPDHVSWNAGVMMFHPSHAHFIPDVYALTDQFYPPTLNHASEQYAFSIMMQENTSVIPCDGVIYHYWYRVKKQIIDLFLEEKIGEDWAKRPLEEKLYDVEVWSRLLPGYFDSHVLMIRDKAIQAFNENQFLKAYQHTAKALSKEPFEPVFLKDVLYHTKRWINNQESVFINR